MLPPARARGGMVECSPGSAGAVPVTPRNGATGTAKPYWLTAVVASIVQLRNAGSPSTVPRCRCRASSRMPAIVYPHSAGRSDSTCTARYWPGCAPSTTIGPARQWPRPDGNMSRRSCPSSRHGSRWPPESKVRTASRSPERIVTAGGTSQENASTTCPATGSSTCGDISPLCSSGRRERRSVRRREQRGVPVEVERPALVPAHGVAHGRPAAAVPVEVAVLEFHAGALRCLGDEPDLDLARQLRVGLELPAQADVPAEGDAVRRLVDEHPRPAALAAVHRPVVDVPADAGLEDRLRDGGTEQVVLGWLEVAEALGKDGERPL